MPKLTLILSATNGRTYRRTDQIIKKIFALKEIIYTEWVELWVKIYLILSLINIKIVAFKTN